MIKTIPAAQRHTRDFGWLKTAWLFSFDDYYDPENVQFSALHVFNDDVVQPGRGFPLHPHREAEIITIPLSGELTHQDSDGNHGVVGPGDVQRMSAGVGINHSEMNQGTVPVHLYQIWFLPDQSRLEPSYAQRHFSPEEWHNRLLPLASGRGLPDVITFHADATLFRSELTAGQELEYDENTARCYFLYLTYGELLVNGERLQAHDQARINGEWRIHLTAVADTHFIFMDLPPC